MQKIIFSYEKKEYRIWELFACYVIFKRCFSKRFVINSNLVDFLKIYFVYFIIPR